CTLHLLCLVSSLFYTRLYNVSQVSLLFLFFFFECSVAHRDLHSFPTRRSSDLQPANNAGPEARSRLRVDRGRELPPASGVVHGRDRKSTRLNSSHGSISYAVFCLKKKKKQ